MKSRGKYRKRFGDGKDHVRVRILRLVVSQWDDLVVLALALAPNLDTVLRVL